MAGFWRNLVFGHPDPIMDFTTADINTPAPAFEIDRAAIDPAVFGLQAYGSATAPAPRIDRRSAIQVPAVKRTRDLIAGTIGGLPLDLVGPDGKRAVSRLFQQPEPGTPRSVTMTRTLEDMLFEGVAWWRITEVGWHTYPVKVRRLEPGTVSVADGAVYVEGRKVPDSEMIRFDSPNDALLIAGARAIRTCLHLEAASQRYAEGAPPVDYFTPAEGADPAEDEEIVELLNAWQEARQTRSTGYVPAALKYNVGGWNPEQLQLADARQHAVLEIARLAGIDPEDLGVSTTSRTYANQFDRRKAFIDFTLGGYRQALEDRLSMGDVTPGGYVAKLNLDAFLRSDTKTRMETYEVGLRVGAYDKEEIRMLEDKPPLNGAQVAPMAAEREAAQVFEGEVAVALEGQSETTFSVDRETRTITGLAVPFGKPAMSRGRLYQFAKGTLRYGDVSRVKLLIQHDFGQAVGYVTKLDETDEGLVASFKVARGAEGDRALSLAEDKVLDGLSIGLGNGGKFSPSNGVLHAKDAPLAEISLTPLPSFDDARVMSVAASAALGDSMTDETTTTTATAEPPDFSAVTDAIKQGFESLTFPQREIVSAAGGLDVSEPSPYRFDGTAGAHSFSEDLRSYSSDPEARQRLEKFMEDAFTQFAVTTGNTSTLSPTQNRPDLFVPNLTFTRPLWNLVTNGVVTDKTPFTVPKFASAAGLVGAHTEGVEPTPGSFTATSQTITPGAVSGKVEIVREVWDQGGSPQADQIIWGEMLNGYFEAIEAKIATALAAVPTAEINLASATDAALVNAVQNVLVDLQFTRGGNRFTGFALDGLLFKALVNAADTSGRKLLPVVGPTNAQGQVTGGFDRVQIGNLTGAAAWALGATNASKSYLFVPSSVYAWASAPKKFVFEYRVSAIDLAIWGYTATAVLRDSDVKPVDYTTADA